MAENRRDLTHEWRDAVVTVYGGTGDMITECYGENWRLSLCAPGLFDAGDASEPHNRCPLPVGEMLATHGSRIGAVPHDVARFCADPCTQILWDSQIGWANSGDKSRASKLRALREVRAEQARARAVRL